ncbi:glycogen/starch/alpha-glucan phosphorylase, partial [Escherichia coli]|uniref:glycogen/starch/alpha-glucan phosphorylase n=1 Tax=Escherichia coli TaxID=562 RepID=UPI0021D227B3
MKLALNGALTVGTLAGAPVALAAPVGAAPLFLFGHPVAPVPALLAPGSAPVPWRTNAPVLASVSVSSPPLRAPAPSPDLVCRLLLSPPPPPLLASAPLLPTGPPPW